jgi:hypothetical protein
MIQTSETLNEGSPTLDQATAIAALNAASKGGCIAISIRRCGNPN